MSIVILVEQAFAKNLSVQGGFLPPVNPVSHLDDAFAPYDDAIRLLPELLAQGETRAYLNARFGRWEGEASLSTLSEPQRAKLLSILAFLAHGYRWNRIPAKTDDFEQRSPKDLPAGIYVPWCALSAYYNQPICGTLWSQFLCNWRLRNLPDGTAYTNTQLVLENMEVPHNFLQGELGKQLADFVLCFVLTEARSAIVLRKLIETLYAVEQNDGDAVCQCLSATHQAMRNMNRVFSDIIRKCVINTETWLDDIQRPFVWNLADEQGIRRQGASGMQLGGMSCINIALDLENSSDLAKAVENSRVYMPRAHREFLTVFDKVRPMLRHYMTSSGNHEAKAQYNACIDAMISWRTSHHRRGVEYFKESRKAPGTHTTTGLVITAGNDLVVMFERYMEERTMETRRSKVIANTGEFTEKEVSYLETFKFFVDNDGEVSADERRLLDRQAFKLGLSAARVAELERAPDVRVHFKPHEREYMDQVDFFLSDDGLLDEHERAALAKMAQERKISEARAAVLESFVRNRELKLTAQDEEYIEELLFCLQNDARISADERRALDRWAQKLGISPDRAHRLEDLCLKSQQARRSPPANAIQG